MSDLTTVNSLGCCFLRLLLSLLGMFHGWYNSMPFQS
jgi:hypothetical protein